MPMLLTGRKPDHIAGPNLLDRAALALNPTAAGGDNQSLAERVRMPGGAGTRLECDAAAADTCRIGRLEQRVHAHRAGEILSRPLAGGLRTASFDLHGSIPSFCWDSRRPRLCGGRFSRCQRSEPAGGGEHASARDHDVSWTVACISFET